MKNPKLILIRGYPGSGKTTVGKALEKAGSGVFIDHNAILTFLSGVVGNDEGIYAEIHNLELAMAGKLLKENKNVIVARGFSSPESVEPYQDTANKLGAGMFIFRLVVGKDNLKSRVVADERKEDFNPTIDESALMAWIADNPLQDVQGEHEIDADKSVDKVVSQILSILGSRPVS